MSDLELKKGVKVLFGLEQQGHIPIIESMLKRHCSWDEINKQIGWAGDAAQKDYIRYLQKRNNTLEQKLQGKEQKLKSRESSVRVVFSKWFPEYKDYKHSGFDCLISGLDSTIVKHLAQNLQLAKDLQAKEESLAKANDQIERMRERDR